MGLTCNYLVVHSQEADVEAFLVEILRNALANDADFSEEDLSDAVTLSYCHKREDKRCISGISVHVDLDISLTRAEDIIEDVSTSLADYDEEGIEHVLKLYDPVLRDKNLEIAKEIFEIEMKLREALALIFIDTYGGDYYNLLKEVFTNTKGDADAKLMKTYFQDEFFYLEFKSYIAINKRKVPTDTKQLIQCIRDSKDIEELHHKLSDKSPVSRPLYKGFLKGLNQYMSQIETVRNCVAHNRAITQTAFDNFQVIKDKLLEFIEDFLKEVANLS